VAANEVNVSKGEEGIGKEQALREELAWLAQQDPGMSGPILRKITIALSIVLDLVDFCGDQAATLIQAGEVRAICDAAAAGDGAEAQRIADAIKARAPLALARPSPVQSEEQRAAREEGDGDLGLWAG
jgi:hypothetical protein